MLTRTIACISKTTKPIKMKIQDNIWNMKMQYYDVKTNSRWRTAAILKIVISLYLGEKSSDCNKIWYTSADYE